MDLISKTLHHIGQNYKDASVVQIGAMDGLNFDDTRGFLNLYGWKSLLVEPVPAIFNELKENFKDRTNYTFEQCAITENDGEIEMLTIPPDVIIQEGLHPGYKGMSALYPLKNGFNSESQRDIDIKTKFGINITVPSLTFDSLLKKHNIEYFDILICDAEGYDWNIFNQLDLTKYRPKFIRLEYMNLTDEEKVLTRAKLAYHGYIVDISHDIDAVAVEIYQELQDIEEEILKNISLSFNNIVLKYGSDKIQSGYNNYYSKILESIRHDNINHLEIGLGTLMPEIESSFAGVTNSYPHYKPSACLRMWREYFTNGNIYGMDVAEDCMIEEERIKTFLMSSLDSSSCITNLKDLEFDVIIDDGLHTAIAQITTFKNLFSKVKEGGYYVIEDIKGGGDGINVFNEYNKELMEVINEHECFYNYYLDISQEGTFLCIRKNYSKRGLTNDTEEFSKNTYKSQSNEIESNKHNASDKNYIGVFDEIYNQYGFANNGFGNTESKSGPGSSLENTENLRIEIKKLVQEKNIKSVVDVPCGDFNWMKEIVDIFDSYIGGDIVDECIKVNNEKYSNDKIKFINFDLIEDTIPTGDLLFIRDVLGHMPLESGLKVIQNILKSDCKYLLTTTWFNINDEYFYKKHINNDVDYGWWYAINLLSKPFYFPRPELHIEENGKVDGYDNGNRKILGLWDISKLKEHFSQPIQEYEEIMEIIPENNTPTINVNKNLTIVTGLWDINRTGRSFDHYIENFKKFLDIPQNLFIYIPKEYEYLVWEKRTPENTFVKIYELDDVKNIYRPFWDKTQEIRNNPEWLNLAGWLPDSPQAQLEWYNPIVQSKMFMLNDSSIWNPFNTEYFFWLDAGITNTVPHTHLVENNILDKLTEYGNPFLFLSYPYEANTEIHGFEFDAMNRFAGSKVEYVCRGGLFGGHRQQLNEANSTYYSLLTKTMNQGYMGTEESVFTIMSYNEPDLYRRYELDGNGLIVKFTQAVIDNDVKIITPNVTKINNAIKYTDRDVDNLKTNLYILTFNFPEQVLHTIKSMEKTPIWLNKPHLVLLDNSTTEEVRDQNREIAKQYNFEYVSLEGNTGICGGRQAAAEHFNESDADFMFFFEDDMTVNPPEIEGQFCRNGFRKYIPNLYNIVHKIMLRDKFDFLKLTFTEVYFDNDKQCTWYNVPQTIRTRDWPDYDKLPVTGLDPNAPLTNFKNMRVFDGLAYLDGEVYYANWPMIVSKEGNKKMFIDTKWGHPFEQTWMSHIYQETKLGNIKPAILLAAPIWHDRIKHYEAHERREN